MKTHPRLLVARSLSFPAFALALAFSSATAQTPPPPSLSGDEVITLSTFEVSTTTDRGYRAGNSVSATRIDTPIKDLPFSVTAFTEQFIEDVGATELLDVAKFAPGVTSGAKEFTQGNNRYSIRGFDGDVTPQRNGFVGNRYVDAGNIQRVEVVKGPASLLYGQITPGGTVNYITKRPGQKNYVKLKQQIGTDNYWRTEVDANHVLAGGRLMGRVVGAYETRIEWADPSGGHSSLLAPSVAWKIAENLALIVDYERFRRRELPLVNMLPNMAVNVAATASNFPRAADRGRAQAFIDVGNLNLGFMQAPPLPKSFNSAGTDDYRRSDFDSVNAELSLKLGQNWSARANFVYNDFEIRSKLTGLAEFTLTPAAALLATKHRFDYVAEARANPLAVLSDPTKTATALMTRRKRLEESFGDSTNYQVELTGRQELGGLTLKPLLGGFLSDVDGGSRRRESKTTPPAGVANAATTPVQHFQPWNFNDRSTWLPTASFDEFSMPFNSFNRTDGTDSAVYGILTASLLDDRLIAIGGARYNHTDSTSTNFLPTVAATPGPAVRGSKFSANKTTPQFGLGFKARPDLLLFASYSESFFIEDRSLTSFNPAFNPALPSNTTTNRVTVTTPAKPTTGNGYEFGAKTDFLDGRISSTVSFFHLEREDRVLRFRETAPDGTFPTITRQGTVDESEGVEVEVTWSPLDHWQVFATLTRMNVRTTKAEIPPKASFADPVFQAAYNAAFDEAVDLVIGAVPEGTAEHLASLWTRFDFPQASLKGWWIAGGFVATGKKAQRTANPSLFIASNTVYDLVIGKDWRMGGVNWSGTLSWKNVGDNNTIPSNQSRSAPSRAILSLAARF